MPREDEWRSRRPRVGLATAAGVWDLDVDAEATVAALTEAGIHAEPVVWDDDSVGWESYDLVVIRSTWDYVPSRGEFLAWVDRTQAVSTLANPAEVVRWNTHKAYLADLSSDGVDVVPTTVLRAVPPAAGTDGDGTENLSPAPGAEPISLRDVDAAVASVVDRGRDVVVKPTVSAGSKDTVRHDPDSAEAAVSHGVALLSAGRDVIVQPYLSSVDTRGETGMVFFDGEFSHAFSKGPLLRPGAGPAQGLFAQEQITARVADPAELELARSALHAVFRRFPNAGTLLYARVDVVMDDDGRYRLLELELTEPSFFLWTEPTAAGRFAAAVRARIERR